MTQSLFWIDTRSKPATHLEALAGLDTNDLKASMPKGLKRLLKHVALNVRKS